VSIVDEVDLVRVKTRRTSGESSASTDRAVRAVDARWCEGKGMERLLKVLAWRDAGEECEMGMREVQGAWKVFWLRI
jgi:hypothetical protein